MNPLDERAQLFRLNIEKVEMAYESSVRDGVNQPVVFLCDIRDKSGRMLAEDMAGKEQVEEHLRRVERDAVNWSLIFVHSREDAKRYTGAWRSQGKSQLDQDLGEGVFLVVVIASGGISWMRHSIPSESSGQS